MDPALLAVAALLSLVVLVHSIGGEILVIGPLRRHPDPPPLFGSPTLFVSTIHATWHVASALGLAATATVLAAAADPAVAAGSRFALQALLGAFVASAILVLGTTRGRHPAWVAFSLMSAGLVFALYA